jgi:glycosyltransferase involved in cell wall biosynthesis
MARRTAGRVDLEQDLRGDIETMRNRVMSSTLIIPALNEAECIGPLLAELPVGLVQQVLVVDNGSTDDTAGAARRAGAQVVVELRRGYGYACAAGVASARGDVLAFMDGDGSFVPGELPTLLAPLLDGSADLALGTRMRGGMAAGAMPPHQRFGNQLVARLMDRLYGLRLTDLGPFRAVRSDLVLALNMREMTYGWPVEMIVKAARRHARIVELPVSYRPRIAGRSKVGGTVRGTLLATYRILRTTLRYAGG